MLKNPKTIFLELLIILSMYIVGISFYNSLPNDLPMHWNTAGEPDSFMDKSYGAFLIPTIALVIVILFEVLSKIDPKKEKYKLFVRPWNILKLIIISYFAYFYFVTIHVTLNPEKNIGTFAMIGIGTLFILIGNYLSKIRQNYFVGIKTPWSLSSENVWNKTHRASAIIFILMGLIIISEAFLWYYPFEVTIITVIIGILSTLIYSYLAYQKEISKK